MDLPEYLRRVSSKNMLQPEPWGYYKKIYNQKWILWVKEMFVSEGERTSLQSHEARDEYFFFIKGYGSIRIGKHIEKCNNRSKGRFFFCPRNLKHRIEGGKNGIMFVEVAMGVPKESDITRYEDDYKRM